MENNEGEDAEKHQQNDDLDDATGHFLDDEESDDEGDERGSVKEEVRVHIELFENLTE